MRKTVSLLMLTMLLVPCVTGCRAGAETRTGEAEGYGGKLTVSVTMNGEDITSVKVVSHQETEGVGTRAIEALPPEIVKTDSTDVDVVSGATITSNAIRNAVSQAIGMTGVIQDMIPMDGQNADEANRISALTGVGMASTGRVGPGKAEDGSQVYSVNVVFAAGQFEEDGTIRSMQIDQLEVLTPNLGGGSAFSGFPGEAEGEEAFLNEVAAWRTKSAMGEDYMLESGSWREQMDLYQQQMTGKTVAEFKEWYMNRGNAAQNADSQTAEPESAQPARMDVASSATISLQGEYGDILLAMERAWEDARNDRADQGGAMVDTNTVTDATEGENSVV